MSHWIDLEKKYYMQTGKRLPIVLVRGEGCRVWDENGKAYLDMVAGIAVNVLGHCHPAVVEALTRQANQLIHVSNLYYTIPQLELAQLLVEHSCADQVFFSNSGAEANEGAIKLARKWGKLRRDGAYEIITMRDSFHGRTITTVAATGQEKFQKPFAPMPPGFVHVPFNDIEAVRAATNERTVAIMIEVVQGESGVNLASWDYVRALRSWCDQNKMLLIIDEVQTGMGRTGRFLAYEHAGIEPDIFTMAKGLAGGVPIGCVLAKSHASCFDYSDHGSTFGGNPLACSAALATLRFIFDHGLIDHAAKMGNYLLDGLRRIAQRRPNIVATRGLGLMVAFDLKDEVALDFTMRALDKGLILNNTGPKTVRMVPPLIITKTEANEALSTIDIVASSY